MKIEPNSFALVCFFALMQGGEGLITKHPTYIAEKWPMIGAGYDAFGYLDFPNMGIVMGWMAHNGVEFPPQIEAEYDRQVEAYQKLQDKGLEV